MSKAEQLIETLKAEGFQGYTDNFREYEHCSLQKRIDGLDDYKCLCNGKVFVNVVFSSICMGGKIHESVEAELRQENSSGQWFNIKCYGVSVEEFINDREGIIGKLIAAWKAVY